MWKWLRINLVAGLLALLPLYLTVIILVKVFLFIDGFLSQLATKALVRALNLPLSDDQVIYGLGFITLIILLAVTGRLARLYIGNWMIAWFNLILDRVPIVNNLYKTLRQIAEALFSGKKNTFQKPVLIEYPRKGLYCLAFQTSNTGGIVARTIQKECLTIFLPSTPNPTTGFLLYVPKTDVFQIDMTMEEAMKLIISGGVINSDDVSIEVGGDKVTVPGPIARSDSPEA